MLSSGIPSFFPAEPGAHTYAHLSSDPRQPQVEDDTPDTKHAADLVEQDGEGETEVSLSPLLPPKRHPLRILARGSLPCLDPQPLETLSYDSHDPTEVHLGLARPGPQFSHHLGSVAWCGASLQEGGSQANP